MALNNLHISVVKSNEFEDSDLARVASKIKENKAIYCTNLTKKVTYLICLGTDFTESEKYKKAKRLGTVNFVTEKWLDVAISQKTLPPAFDYDPELSFNNDSVDSVVKSPKKAGKDSLVPVVPSSPSKPKLIDRALADWCVFISGKHSRSHGEIRKLIEEHGGSVVATPSDRVTHVLGESEKCQTLLAHGAQAITEDFLEQAIHVKQELSSPVKSLLPSPRKSHNKKIESIVRKRMIRGSPFYEVQYLGLGDENNELLAADDIIKGGGQNVLKKFEKQYQQEMNEMFTFTKTCLGSEPEESISSPKKQTTPAKLKKEIGIVPFATPKRGRKPKAATFKNTTSPAKTTPKRMTQKKPKNTEKPSPAKIGTPTKASKKKDTPQKESRKPVERKRKNSNAGPQATKKRKINA